MPTSQCWIRGAGAVLCALAVATHVGARIWPAPIQMDSRFAWNSLATVALALTITLVAWLMPDRGDRPHELAFDAECAVVGARETDGV